MKISFESIQSLGRALMLPIAILPIAGILLRLGQPDLLNIPILLHAGSVIFENLAFLFAIGVAVGLAKDNNGTAGLASAVGFWIMTAILTQMNKDINMGVLGGILIGIVSALLYNKFKDIRLPEYLAFFGGKRFVPIITGLTAVLMGVIFGYIWPPIQNVINSFGHVLMNSGGIGLFVYGVLNRLFLITGLHHILNNLVWFVFGDFTLPNGIIVHGDISRFANGDPNAGYFMSGFFPIMMFGLPAACFAMYKTSFTKNRKVIVGLLVSMALTSFLTGVTEPIEFTFLFLAPMLFLIHAILTGLSMAIMYYLHVRLGFTFSAGLFDYVLFFGKAQNPLYLLPVGLVYALVYYWLFVFFIKKFNLTTLGRDVEFGLRSTVESRSDAIHYIEALGGEHNIINIDACTTRLRLKVIDSSNIKQNKLKELGAKGILAPTKTSLQIIMGPQADIIASNIRDALQITEIKPVWEDIEITAVDDVTNEILLLATNILNACGGITNIKDIQINALTRIRLEVINNSLINKDILISLGIFAVININDTIKQLYCGDNCNALYVAMVKLST